MTTNALTLYAANALMDHLMGVAAFTQPTEWWLKAHLGDPGESAANNAAATTNRVEITSWDAAATLAASNAAAASLTMTAAETVAWWSVWDASTGGNPLFYGQLTTPRALALDDLLEIGIGDIDLDFVGTNLSTYSGNGLLDHLLGNSAFTSPASRFMQFHTGAPGLAGTANIAALSTRSNAGNFSAASGGATANVSDIDATGAATETLSFGSIFDASTVGNCLWQFPFTTSKSVDAATPVRLVAGIFTPSLN